MALAAGTCPNCGHSEKRVLREGRARTIFTCPECQKGRIIARKIKMENPPTPANTPAPTDPPAPTDTSTQTNSQANDSGDEGTGGRTEEEKEGKKEEAKGNPPTKDEKTDGKQTRKVSSVKKATYAKRSPKRETPSSVSTEGGPKGGGGTAPSGRGRKAKGDTSHPTDNKAPTGRAKREPRREPVAARTAKDRPSESPEDWRGVYPYIY